MKKLVSVLFLFAAIAHAQAPIIHEAADPVSPNCIDSRIIFSDATNNAFIGKNGACNQFTSGAGGGTAWSSLTAPTADFSLDFGGKNTTFTNAGVWEYDGTYLLKKVVAPANPGVGLMAVYANLNGNLQVSGGIDTSNPDGSRSATGSSFRIEGAGGQLDAIFADAEWDGSVAVSRLIGVNAFAGPDSSASQVPVMAAFWASGNFNNTGTSDIAENSGVLIADQGNVWLDNAALRIRDQTQSGAGGVAIKTGTGAVQLGDILKVAPTATGAASINIPTGTAPSAPADGDIWREDNTNTGLKIRINGVTKTITVG